MRTPNLESPACPHPPWAAPDEGPHAAPTRTPAPHRDLSLSPAARLQIARLARRRPGRFLWEAFKTWLVLAASVALAVRFPGPWTLLLAIVLVATRQNVLGLLVHEQSHCNAFKARHGDTLVNLLAAYPLLVLTVEGYARVHLAHHSHFFTEQDPDFQRKRGDDWETPLGLGRFLGLLLTDLLGLNIPRLLRGKSARTAPSSAFSRRHPTPSWVRWAYYGCWAGLLTWSGTWDLFLLYWLLPLATVFQAIVRWGALCEHRYNRPPATLAESTPLILPRWWEKLLLPNLNFTLHLYHHYFPGIPFCALPEVHRIIQREGLTPPSPVFKGQWAYLKFLTGHRKPV